MKNKSKRPAHRPQTLTPGVKSRPVNIPCTAEEHARITSTTSGAQRLAVLLKLCDDIDAVIKPASDKETP